MFTSVRVITYLHFYAHCSDEPGLADFPSVLLLNLFWRRTLGNKQQQQQSFYDPLYGSTRISQYQKKHSPTRHPDHHPIFISFFHLLWSIASSLFRLRAWQSFLHNLLGISSTVFSVGQMSYLSPNSVKALKGTQNTDPNWPGLVLSSSTARLLMGRALLLLHCHRLSDASTS